MPVSPSTLRRIRNNIPIKDCIMNLLNIEHKFREGHLRFLCLLCQDMHTSTSPYQNLALCFRCKKNFNPIDLYMLSTSQKFTRVIVQLERMLPYYESIMVSEQPQNNLQEHR